VAASNDTNASVQVKVEYLLPILLWTLAFVLFFKLFVVVRIIGLGFLAALITASALRPLKQLFPGPRWWSAALSVLLPGMLMLCFVAAMSWLLSEPVSREFARIPEARAAINEQLAYWSDRLDFEQRLTVEEIIVQVSTLLGQEAVATTTGVLINLVIVAAFITFGSLFLLGEKPGRLIMPVLAILPEPRRPQLRAALADLDPRLRWWLIGTAIDMAAVGVASWIGYQAVGLRFAGPVAVLAGLFEIVPTFGPLAAFLIALLFAAAQDRATVIGVTVVYIIIQTLESNLLQPFVMKKAVHMPPVVTLFTVVLWSKVFGLAGLILALPINIVLWTFFDRFVLRPREAESGSPDDASKA